LPVFRQWPIEQFTPLRMLRSGDIGGIGTIELLQGWQHRVEVMRKPSALCFFG
jgi:hypothetical protein